MISVVVPSYHSWATLPGCLRALERQSRQPDEVLVVNSSDDTRTAEVVAQSSFATFIQSRTRLLPHAARNVGIGRATGGLLVMTDPDCEAEPDWIENLARAWEAGASILGGAMDVLRPGWLENGIHLVKFAHALAGSPQGSLPFASTANAAFTRAVFDRIGPFRGDLMSGDAWFSRAAISAGLEICFVPDAIVRHVHGHSVQVLCRERFRRGIEFARAGDDLDGAPLGARRVRATLALPGILRALAKNGGYARRAGWAARFVVTAPIQLAGQLAWGLGEAKGHLSR